MKKKLTEQMSRIKELINLDEGVADTDLDKYEILCRDVEGQLKELIEYIGENGNGGHSFSIVVDPGDENEKKFFWDGDGGDFLKSVTQTQKRKTRT